MPSFLSWLLFGLATYLLAGMVLTHYTPLGKKYFANTRTRLIFLWIFPLIGLVLFAITIVFSILIVDVLMFGDNNLDGGLEKLFRI